MNSRSSRDRQENQKIKNKNIWKNKKIWIGLGVLLVLAAVIIVIYFATKCESKEEFEERCETGQRSLEILKEIEKREPDCKEKVYQIVKYGYDCICHKKQCDEATKNDCENKESVSRTIAENLCSRTQQ